MYTHIRDGIYVISKNVTWQSTNSDRVVFWFSSTETLYDSDIVNIDTNVRPANLNTIETIISPNSGSSITGTGVMAGNVAVGNGTWDFSEIGGIPLSLKVGDSVANVSAPLTVNGNGVIVVLRS